MKKIVFTVFIIFLPASVLLAQGIDVIHYKFNIRLTDDTDSIYGEAMVTYLAKDSSSFAKLDLKGVDLHGKGMKVNAVEVFSNGVARLRFNQDAEQISFPSIVKGGRKDTQQVLIRYKGIPDDGLIISKNKFGDRTFFGDNWPNRAHHWLPCVDRPDDKATFEFVVTAPPQYSVISNGEKVAEKLLDNRNKLTHWREDVSLPTKVMVIGAARFATKTYNNSPGGLPVSAWVYPQDSTKGFYDYAVAPEIVKFFSTYIAPFPYQKLANVQSTTIFGGMENASCIFYDEKLVTGDRKSEDVVAHEIAHQWFGDMASEKSFAHVWLSEGFATYFTNLYWEQKYGKAAMVKRLEKDREEVIAFAGQSNRPVVDSTSNLMALLNANSYQKGGWVLHMLRNEVGKMVFQNIIRSYYNQYKGGNADTRDFEAVAERTSGRDLKWFFDQWLYKSSIPILEVRWKPTRKLIRIRQAQEKVFCFPLEISFSTKEGKRVCEHYLITEKDQEFAINENAKADSIILDPNTNLLFEGSYIIEEEPKFKKKKKG